MFYLKNLQVAQGILFLVDNTGQCPTDQSFREFTDAAIAQHLMRQSYYYQHHGKTGAGNRRKGTAKWVRSNFKFLWTNIKPESGHMKHGDLADALFRAKSQVLTEDALQHYGYDSKSFQESELPGFVSDDGNTPPSREQTQTSAISAPRTSQVNFPGSTLKRRSESPDELSLSDHAAKRPRIEDPVVLADAESSPLDMPRCRPCVQSNEDCDRQQPCGRCTSAGISLADCTSGDSAARKDDMIMPESNIGNYRRDAEANISSSLSAQAMPLPPPPPSIGEKRGLEEADDPQQHAAKRPRPGTGDADAEIHITTSHKSWSKLVDDQTEPDDASASLGKRKRETGDTGVNTNLTDDDAMRGPHPSKASKRQATEPSVELGKDDDQLQLTMPVLPEQTDSLLTSNVTSATPKVTFHQEDLDDMPSTTHESRDKDATQPQANGLRVNKQGGFSRLLLKFPITPIQRRMSDLQRELEETVEKLFVHIGRIHEFPCPLIEDPDDELEALYVRCWGVQWRTIFHECVNNNSFQASAVIASLISGFLLDNVLTQRGPLESLAREVRKMLEASGTYGQDLLARINLHQQVLDHTKEVRVSAVQEARAMLAQDDATLQFQLQSQAERLTKQLWRLLEPHFRELSVTAKHFHRSAGDLEESLIEVFESSMTKIMKSALHHKLLLALVEEGECNYTWPSFDEEYDLDRMKPYRQAQGWRRSPRVSYTAFPGIRITLSNGYMTKDYDSLVAAVRLWVPPHSSDFEF